MRTEWEYGRIYNSGCTTGCWTEQVRTRATARATLPRAQQTEGEAAPAGSPEGPEFVVLWRLEERQGCGKWFRAQPLWCPVFNVDHRLYRACMPWTRNTKRGAIELVGARASAGMWGQELQGTQC